MNDTLNNDQRLETKPAVENKTAEQLNQINADADVQQVATAVETSAGASEILTGMAGKEVKESVSTRAAENKTAATGKKKQSSQHSDDKAAIRQQLAQGDNTPPTQQVMVRKVKRALMEEIRHAKKEVKKFKRNAVKYAHRLAEAFSKLRTLKNLLQDIRDMATEFIQMLFEKVMNKQPLAAVQY